MTETPEKTKTPSTKTNNPSGLSKYIDRDELFRLRAVNGNSVDEIVKVMGIGRRTIYTYLKKWRIPSKKALEAYKESRADLLSNNQRVADLNITKKKFSDATLNQLVTAQKAWHEMERLQRDQSTINQASLKGSIDDLSDKEIEALQQVAKDLPRILDELEAEG